MCCDVQALEIIISKLKVGNVSFGLLSVENVGCVAVKVV